MEKFTNGTAGGLHISGAPLTTENTAKAAPELLRNSIDSRIVRIRPMSTPLDQLSRCGGSRPASSMTVEYYSVDTKQTETVLAAEFGGGGKKISTDLYTYALTLENPEIFEISDTVLIPSVEADGTSPLVAYVHSFGARGEVEVIPVNGRTGSPGTEIPELPVGTKVVRMGRAASELDVQTPQFQALPVKSSNNCQIFKIQVEQSTLQKIAEKEVDWKFSDQEEAAVIDMRLGMEKNFLFGKACKFYNQVKGQDVYLTGGIWGQAGGQVELNVAAPTEADLISLCARAFTGNNGSKRKILIGGTALIEALSKIQAAKTVAATGTFVKWGLEFNEIRTNFGSLYVLHSEIFDACGHAADGMIIDPDYITKYTHIPFNAATLDLRSSGQRNTDAVVLTEASCLVLRFPGAHFRVIGTNPDLTTV